MNRSDPVSVFRVGTTEGRFRMVMPSLMEAFNNRCPRTRIEGVIGNAEQLRAMLMERKIDLAFSGISPLAPKEIEKELLFDEHLFFVISDGLLARYFSREEAERFCASPTGIDMQSVAGKKIPVCRSLPNLHCMQILDALLEKDSLALDCIHESGHFDLHQEMAVRDLAACFCLSMYIPHLLKINENSENKLHVLPIAGLTESNPVYILRMAGHAMPEGTDVFTDLLKDRCRRISALEPQTAPIRSM